MELHVITQLGDYDFDCSYVFSTKKKALDFLKTTCGKSGKLYAKLINSPDYDPVNSEVDYEDDLDDDMIKFIYHKASLDPTSSNYPY